MSHTKYTDTEAKWGVPMSEILETMYAQHGSYRAVARQLGVSLNTVTLWWMRCGLPEVSGGKSGRPRKVSVETARAVRQGYEAGLTRKLLAYRYRLPMSSVIDIIRNEMAHDSTYVYQRLEGERKVKP